MYRNDLNKARQSPVMSICGRVLYYYMKNRNRSEYHLTHYQTTNFRFFQTERVCGRQFLLFPQCFQKACFSGASKVFIVWECVNGFIFYQNVELVIARKVVVALQSGTRSKFYFITN